MVGSGHSQLAHRLEQPPVSLTALSHVLLGTATKYLNKSLLLPGKGSCCLLKGLLSNGHDPLPELTTPA